MPHAGGGFLLPTVGSMLTLMLHRPRLVQLSFVAATLMALAGAASPKRSTVAQQSSAPDSITVRVAYKGWGRDVGDCSSPDWGWDSLTWRLRPGDTVGGEYLLTRIRVGPNVGADSIWLAFPKGAIFGPGIPRTRTFEPEGWDSALVTPQPTEFGTNSYDGGVHYRIRTLPAWPEPPRQPVKTTNIVGRVVDDSSGQAPRWANVIVLGTKLGTYTDTLGIFTLTGVPVGRTRLDVCAFCYTGARAEVEVPRDTLTIRLQRDSRCRFTR